MKNLKKVLALVLAVVMVMGAVVTTSAAYKDVKDTDTYANAIDVLSNIGILDGFEDGTFKADGTLTRAQAAKIVAIVHNAKTNGWIDTDIDELYANAQNPFVDCNNSWALPYINYCRITGLADGMTATTYEPNRVLTGVQFLKLMLTTLGFDTAKEGYTGTGWDINVLNRANEIGLLAGLATGWKAIAPVTRGEAAQILYNALSNYVVEYGQKVTNTYNDTKKIYASSFISNEIVKSTTEALAETMGVGYTTAHDVFMRPGILWSYPAAGWSAFYLNAAAKTYTGKVTVCDMLVDLGVAKTSNAAVEVYFFRNGKLEYINSNYSHTLAHGATGSCDTAVANTGALTQVYKLLNADGDGYVYFVTVVDTFLAKVTAVTPSKHHDAANSTTTLELYAPNYVTEKSKFADTYFEVVLKNLTSYAKGDYILVNLSANAIDDVAINDDAMKAWFKSVVSGYSTIYTAKTKAWDNSTKTVYTNICPDEPGNQTISSATLIPYVMPLQIAGTIDGATFSGKNADWSVMTVNGTKTPVNCTYTLTDAFEQTTSGDYDYVATDILEAKKALNFFVDQYGNVIGDNQNFTSNYAIVDAAKWVNDGDLTATEYAQFALVGLDAKTTYGNVVNYNGLDVTGSYADELGHYDWCTVSQNAANNYLYTDADRNYGFVQFVEADGKYALVQAGRKLTVTDGKIGAGQINLGLDQANWAVYANADTKFIVRTLDAAGKHVYTAYNGVNELPTMSNVTAAIHVTETGKTYASVVYVIADYAIYAGSSVVAYVADTKYEYAEFGDVYTYNVYIDGVKTPITVIGKTGSDTNENIFAAGVGLYKINFLTGDAKVSSVKKLDTADGWKSAEVLAESAGDGAIVVTDSTGLNVSGAKIYTVDMHELTVAEADASKLVAGCTVYYKLVTGSTYMVEAIYVVYPA